VELELAYGRNLRRLRKARGYSQEALADRAEVHRTEVGLLERGERGAGVEVTLRLAGALGVHPGDLFEGSTYVPAEDGREARFAYDLPSPVN